MIGGWPGFRFQITAERTCLVLYNHMQPLFVLQHHALCFTAGTYPHIQAQQVQCTTPSRAAGKSALTHQEMQAAAAAAAEHGFDDREYFVDDGGDYCDEEYEAGYYGETSGYVGAEGRNLLSYKLLLRSFGS